MPIMRIVIKWGLGLFLTDLRVHMTYLSLFVYDLFGSK